MTPGLRRRLAMLACRALELALPHPLQTWGCAVRHEVEAIEDDTQAAVFALHSLCGIVPRIVARRLLHRLVALFGDAAISSGGMASMRFHHDFMRDPRSVGIACAAGAALLGLVYMATTGAPMRYLGVNAGALGIGLAMFALVARAPESGRWHGALTLVTAMILLLTALLGDRADGAARWVALGGLSVQPSLVLLPAIIIGFARSRCSLSLAGMMLAAAALAVQPDRAMAGVLAAGLAALAVLRPDRLSLPAFAAALAGFAVTLLRADTLPAVPYVDQIFYSSFDVHVLAGLAVLGGAALLLAPAVAGGLFGAGYRTVFSVFGAVWLTVILAAALGNYPTPVVGYGGSAILGYLLSLTMLPRKAPWRRPAGAASGEGAQDRESGGHLRVEAAQAA